MLITTIEEVKAQLPTSQWSKFSKLSAALDDAEETYLMPLLGIPLFEQIRETYSELVQEYSSIVPPALELSSLTDSDTVEAIRLIRQCQRVEILFMLANNSGLLAVSLNEGGGMNMVTGGNYDSSDENTMKRFVADAWSNAHRAADNLLAMLERDARTDNPQFAEAWKESESYYMHEDLLFSTAQELNRLYPIKNSREKFIDLVPQLRQCQATYIEPEIGFETLNSLLATRTSNQEDGDHEKASIRKKVIEYLQMALVCFMRYKSAPARERDVKDMADGDMHMGQAKSMLALLKEPDEEPEIPDEPEEPEEERKCCCCSERFNGRTNDSLFDPFDGGLDRI